MGGRIHVSVRDMVLRKVAKELQILIRGSSKLDERLRSLVSELPAPASPLEALAVRGLLYDWMAGTGLSRRWRVVWGSQNGYSLEPLATTDEGGGHSPTSIAREAHKQIIVSLSEIRSASALAARLGCERERLDRAFREVYGSTVASYLREVRVKEAMRLLRTTDHKVEAIALMVGFRGKANLYHALRQKTGQTPSEFRRRASRRNTRSGH